MSQPDNGGTVGEFHAHQLHLLLQNSPSAVLVNGAIAAITWVAIPAPGSAWLGWVLVAAALRLALWGWQGRKPVSREHPRPLFWLLLFTVLCQGVAWGFASWQLFLGTTELYRFYLIAIVCGMTGGASLLLSSSIACFAAFALPTTLPLLYLLLTSGTDAFFHAGLMGVVFVPAVHAAAWRIHRSFREQVVTRVAYQRAAAELGRHKDGLELLIRERTADLEAAKENYRRLIEEVNDVVFEVDRAGVITYMSPAMEALCGWRAEELEGRPFQQFIFPEDLAAVQTAFQGLLVGKMEPLQYRIIDREGRPRWVRSSSRPVHYGSEVSGLRGVLSDIEETKRAEAEHRQTEDQLNQARKLEAVGTLAGGVAHEFNNILASVLGYAELGLLHKEVPAELRAYLSSIQAAGLRGRDIVRQILSFSRPSPTGVEAHDAKALVAEGLQVLRVTLPGPERLVENLQAGAGHMRVAPTQFQQILTNLCSNAFQALQPGSGRVEVVLRKEEILPAVATHQRLAPGPYVVLEVRDDGAGMDEATLARVFEPFFTTRKLSGGTGLGLPVVHGIVQAHQGTLTLTSTPGRGTTATVYLPAAEPAPKTAGPQPVRVTGRGQPVLFLDDEPMLVEVACAQLQALGFTARGFSHPGEALEVLRSAPYAFDLVITDLSMPEMDGIEFARAVEQLRPGLPVLLHTGHMEDRYAGEDLPACVRRVLAKPLQRAELAAAVAAALGLSGGVPEPAPVG